MDDLNDSSTHRDEEMLQLESTGTSDSAAFESSDSLEWSRSHSDSPFPSAVANSLYNSAWLAKLGPQGFVWLVSIFSSVSGLLFGLDVGIISGALLFMESTFHLSPVESEVVISIVLVGSFFGSLSGGWLSDTIGRWRSILLATVSYLVGALLMAFSTTKGLWMIYIGRLIIGYAIGVSTLTVTLYLAEVAPASARGMIVSVNEVAIVSGIFLSFFLNWAVSGAGDTTAWRLAFGISAIPAVVQIIGMFFLPYSPRWLLYKGRGEEAMQILLRTRQLGEAEAEYRELQQSLQLEARQRVSFRALVKELFSSSMRWPLSISALLTFFQQASGQPTVLLYSSKIIKLTGIFPSNSTTLLAALLPGSVKLIITIISSFWLIEHLGRRTLLLVGSGGILVSLIFLGFVMLRTHMDLLFGWIALLLICSYLGFYAASYGPISWLYMSEVFPQHLRASGMSVATMVNWSTQAVVSFTFLSAVNTFGPSAVFWTYAVIGVIAFGFIWYRVPETKGKTLEELALIFQSGQTANADLPAAPF